jgi:mannose-6-phosphate isomerase-like protein (cupin superfamily)
VNGRPKGKAVFVTAATAPTKSLRYDRGTHIRLVDEGVGALKVDLHINVLKAGGAPGPFHLHNDVENAYYVLHGTVLVKTADEERVLQPGDAAFFPRGVAHSATNVGPDDAQVIEIYAPTGPDFVELDGPGLDPT